MHALLMAYPTTRLPTVVGPRALKLPHYLSCSRRVATARWVMSGAANLAASTTALNEYGSVAAKSASTLRLSCTPAMGSALMSLEYVTPCRREAALMAKIQLLRKSRFFSLRPMYAFCHDLCTARIATAQQFFLRPKKPRAASKIFSFLVFILFAGGGEVCVVYTCVVL